MADEVEDDYLDAKPSEQQMASMRALARRLQELLPPETREVWSGPWAPRTQREES